MSFVYSVQRVLRCSDVKMQQKREVQKQSHHSKADLHGVRRYSVQQLEPVDVNPPIHDRIVLGSVDGQERVSASNKSTGA